MKTSPFHLNIDVVNVLVLFTQLFLGKIVSYKISWYSGSYYLSLGSSVMFPVPQM